MTEAEFKKHFMVTTDTHAMTNKPHIIIGCTLLSNRILYEIEFDPNKPDFMEWLTKEKAFIESDSLGVHKTVTIGYLTKIHPHLTSHTNLKIILQEVLNDLTINGNLAVELNPSLATQQTDVMTNGDILIPDIPTFKLYKMWISHGCNKH